VRALCESGAVEAEITEGNQWRISTGVLARLQRDDLPPVPRPLPDGSRPGPATNGRAPHGHPELLAAPSDSVIEAAEEVRIAQIQLEKRRIERDLALTEDFFREREEQQEAREAEREREERTHLAERARTNWLQ